MRLVFQRSMDRWAGGFLCRLFSLLYRLTPKGPREPPRRLLVILLSEMGSLVLTIPMFDRIREKYPSATVFALTFARNREVVNLIGKVKPENILTVRDTRFGTLLLDSFRAVARLRRTGIDTVIDCELFSRVSSIFSFLSGADTRVGFHPHRQEGLYRGSFINRPVLYNPYLHISRQFVNLAEAIDGDGMPLVKRDPAGAVPDPPMADVSREEIEEARQALSRDFPGVESRPLVFLYPGGGLLPIRAWPEEHYAELCRTLTRQGYVVGVIGMPCDRDLAERVLAGCDPSRSLNLAGYTKTVRSLLVLFHVGSLLITNDGGPGHFASITPIRTIILFGPETPVLYGPLGGRTQVVYAGLSCSPCLTAYNHRDSPCDGNNVCLKRILPGELVERAVKILERASAK